MKALEVIESAGVAHGDPVADLGCRGGILLTWLHQRGFNNLWGCDLRAPLPPLRGALRTFSFATLTAGVGMYAKHRRRMRRAPVESTGFPDKYFAAVTCMSVIEHGVDVDAFLGEAARILLPDGLLVLSTDYWPTPIDLRGLKRFKRTPGTDRIFDRFSIRALCEKAEASGLNLIVPLELDAGEPVVEASGYAYTFVVFAFRRELEHRPRP